MNLADITTKCYILALIIRDDGERLLLGDGAYEFKDSQQHFIANTYANDVVELQGTDGQMLAGQVRRTATQTFAGYIGDATFSKQKIEEARRDFLMFFRKKHYYTAVYVFSDGTAIQRDRGYIVNAPSAPELYQRFPEWSVGLNFEDPNYYEYAEDDLGQEIAAHKVELELSTAMSGGLIWDEDGAVSDDLSYIGTEIEGEGKNFQLADTGTATLKSADLLGDATQTTYSGKNLADLVPSTNGTLANSAYLSTAETVYDSTLKKNVVHLVANGAFPTITYALPARLESDKYYSMAVQYRSLYTGTNPVNYQEMWFAPNWSGNNWDTLGSYTNGKNQSGTTGGKIQQSTSWTTTTLRFHVNTTQYSDVASSYTKICFSMGNGILNGTTAKEVWIADVMLAEITQAQWNATNYTDEDYEPYVGGTASPNPDYPQAVNTVTGEQKVKIEGKNLFLTNRTQGLPSDTTYTSATKRLFNFDEYVVGLTMNNYFVPTNITSQSVSDNTISVEVSNSGYGLGFPIETKPSTGYTASFTTNSTATDIIRASFFSADGSLISWDTGSNTQTEYRFTTPADCAFTVLVFRPRANILTTYSNIMLVEGSTAEPFEPYQGQTLPVNLDTIELAKIGNYQDRIYKEDSKWYIEKQVGKVVLDGTESGWGVQNDCFRRDFSDALQDTVGYTKILVISDHFVGRTVCYRGDLTNGKCAKIIGTNQQVGFRYDALNNDVSAWTTWLASNPTTVYYVLATPTTTEITNSELVGQLERLRHSHTYADTANFSITATSPNLPAFLKVVAFGKDATPQGGYVWEDGGAGGATTITVDGVDNAQPIWTVVGPATNPSLTNITTGESIQWTGVVPNGQTLVVNMADMTASLSGANVFEFISGSWITLQAGNNRVSYSATAATGIATLEWNGVVG